MIHYEQITRTFRYKSYVNGLQFTLICFSMAQLIKQLKEIYNIDAFTLVN